MQIQDIDSAAQAVQDHIKHEAARYAPEPVLLTVINGAGQFLYGYVWCQYGDRTVACIAPGPEDLTLVTSTNQAVIWALPPNPNNPNGFYFKLGVALAPGSSVNRYAPLIASHLTTNDGQLLLAWLEL